MEDNFRFAVPMVPPPPVIRRSSIVEQPLTQLEQLKEQRRTIQQDKDIEALIDAFENRDRGIFTTAEKADRYYQNVDWARSVCVKEQEELDAEKLKTADKVKKSDEEDSIERYKRLATSSRLETLPVTRRNPVAGAVERPERKYKIPKKPMAAASKENTSTSSFGEVLPPITFTFQGHRSTMPLPAQHNIPENKYSQPLIKPRQYIVIKTGERLKKKFCLSPAFSTLTGRKLMTEQSADLEDGMAVTPNENIFTPKGELDGNGFSKNFKEQERQDPNNSLNNITHSGDLNSTI